jgi:hypothetical protein
MIKKYIYFIVFIFWLVAFLGSDLYVITTNWINNLFVNASVAMSGVLAPEAVIVFPLIALTVIVAFISILRD